jgi:hypothetical protein
VLVPDGARSDPRSRSIGETAKALPLRTLAVAGHRVAAICFVNDDERNWALRRGSSSTSATAAPQLVLDSEYEADRRQPRQAQVISSSISARPP